MLTKKKIKIFTVNIIVINCLILFSCSPVRVIKVKGKDGSMKNIKIGPIVKENGILFRYKADKATYSLTIAGDFNQWNPEVHRLTKKDNNIWEIYIIFKNIKRMHRIEYKFIRNGTEWKVDPSTQNISDGYGGRNSVFIIK